MAELKLLLHVAQVERWEVASPLPPPRDLIKKVVQKCVCPFVFGPTAAVLLFLYNLF